MIVQTFLDIKVRGFRVTHLVPLTGDEKGGTMSEVNPQQLIANATNDEIGDILRAIGARWQKEEFKNIW